MFSTLPMIESEMVADVKCVSTSKALISSNVTLHRYLHTVCYASTFNPHHCHVIAVCTFEFLILRRLSQATLELRARVCLGYLS